VWAWGGLYWFIMFDDGTNLIRQTSQFRSKTSTVEAEIQRKKLSLERSKQFKETLRIKDEQFQAFSSYIPESLTVADMMRVISNEAKAAGVNIAGISAASAPPAFENELTESLGISVNLEGPFPQQILFLSFLSRLESIFTVADMKFSSTLSKGELGSEEEVNVNFTAIIVGYKYLGDAALQQPQDSRGRKKRR
jgi:type IV pilus assembly protein PilO